MIAATALALGLVTSACRAPLGQAPAAQPPPAHTPVTIHQWPALFNNPVGKSWFREEAAAFHARYPWATVKIEAHVSKASPAALNAAIVAGAEPSALSSGTWTTLAQLEAKGLVMSVGRSMKAANVPISGFLPSVRGMVQYGGHTWGWPQEYDTVFFGWNKHLVAAAGLPATPPHSWARLVADAALLTKRAADGSILQLGVDPVTCLNPDLVGALFGANLYAPSSGQPTFATPAWSQAVKADMDLIRPDGGLAAVQAFLKANGGGPLAFTKGKIGMQFVCDWFPTVNYARDNAAFRYGQDYGLAAPPTGPSVADGTDVTIGGDVFFIAKGAKHPRTAALWFDFLTQTPAITAWCVLESNVPPTTAGVNAPALLRALPWMRVAQRSAIRDLVQPTPPLPVELALQAGLQAEWGAMLGDQVTVGAGLTKAQELGSAAEARFLAHHPAAGG